MAIERKVSVRVEFGEGSSTLSTGLRRYKSEIQDLSRLTSAWQRDLEKVPNLPVGPWLKAQEALKEQMLRSPFDQGPRLKGEMSRLFDEFEKFSPGEGDPLFKKLEPKMNLAGLSTVPPELTGAFAGQKKAADEFRQSIDQLENSLRKQIATAGMSANAARLWEIEQQGLKQGMKRDQIDRLKELQEAADAAADIAQHRREKGLFSGKRIFAGAGFGALGLMTSAIGGPLQQGVGGAMTGAGVMTSLGGEFAGGPAGAVVGSLIGGFFGVVGNAIEKILPTADQFNSRMHTVAESLRRVEEVGARMARGEAPGAAEIGLLPGPLLARVRATGEFGAPGTEASRVEALRRERDSLASSGPRDLPPGLVSWSAMGREAMDTERLSIERLHRERLRILDEGIRRGGIEGLTRPEIPMARGSGGVESIGMEITRAILERSGPEERAASTLDRIAEVLIPALGRMGPAAAPAMP